MELHGLATDSDLQDKVAVAVIVAAQAIQTETPPANHAQRLTWAAAALNDPRREAIRMLWAVLAANKGTSRAQILAATDSVLQAAVDAAVDLFAGGI